MSELIGLVLLLAGAIFLLSMVIAPFESLGWWAGWLGPHEEGPAPYPEADAEVCGGPDYHVVYLSGIASISGDELLAPEVVFLERLRAALPQARIIHDVFPYAPSGRPLLTGQRVFRRLWQVVRRWRGSGRVLLPAILKIRNLFQVLVAADNRYGPIYGYGLSRVIVERLTAQGYVAGSERPVVLLGSSGGAQISIGAAAYLRAALGAPVSVVAFGGVMASDRGVTETGHLVSLYGSGDVVYRLARIGFPGRWPLFAGSHWNMAAREGRLVERMIGPMSHSGRGGYLDAESRAEGRSHVDLTVGAVREAVLRIVKGADPAEAGPV
jgi:hypothetical protein